MSIEDERWQHMANQPFKPSSQAANHAELQAALRVAHALEYIAAQLGMLNAKIDKLTGELAKQRDGSP
jgi:hypothetical protein